MGKDATLAQNVLIRAGVVCLRCADLKQVAAQLDLGAGALLLAEEAIDPDRRDRLDDWLAHQPTWSDLPVLVLTRPGADSATVAEAMERLGNVTVLERPMRVTALVSAVRTALRARQRQYQTREHLAHIARDIHECKRIEEEREKLLESERAARMAAEQAGRLKDDFLATISHELRTPLNGILGWAQLLRRTRQSPESVAEGVAAIERSARMQAQLIDDLLDMNRIVSGKLRLEVQSMELAPVIEAALETVRPSAEAKNIRIQRVLNPAAGLIKGDPTRLQQVVWNLLSNAVKFTPKDGSVQVRLERIGLYVYLSVGDTGMGINPEFLPHVFERFRQADSSTMRKYGGLGLGLAIVKHLVALHGGSVSVASEGEDQGATFQVRLPISIVNQPHDLESFAATAAANTEIRIPGIRILVVDDDAIASEVMRRLLSECEAIVETVASGQEALDRISKSVPDLLLCDVGMPGLDGLEVIRKVRAKHLTVPAIAVTAFARAEDRVRALQAGFNMHLAKPVEANELLTVVDALLRTVAGERGAAK